MLLSVVTPAFKEQDNLPILYERIRNVLDALAIDWEWIIVDDHSPDNTFEVISNLANTDSRVRGVRFSRNFGSHTAIVCGLRQARGDCAVVLAGDLQDPPELVPTLLDEWHKGAQVVWAVRRVREGERISTIVFGWLYHAIIRGIGGGYRPLMGADFFLLDRRVINALIQFQEVHVSVLNLISWMGFRQTFIPYTKAPRLHGKSSWNFEKKLRLALDSITAFSYVPIRVISYMGIVTSVTGFLYALWIILNALTGSPPQGWSSLMVVLLVVSGLQMSMLGILGEYLWRTLDEVKRRPRYIIEATVGEVEDAVTKSDESGSI